MISALGIDVSTHLLALASLDENGEIATRAIALPEDLRGARRLVHIRNALASVVQTGEYAADVVVVEIPWASKGSSFALLSIAGVCCETVQHLLPNAVVLDVPTGTWKLGSVGHGHASKEDVMRHAQGLGYLGGSQDLADAVCMAQHGMERLLATIGEERAA